MNLGTTLAVIAFADQCLKYGNKFVKRCRDYLHAEKQVAELLLSIESNWLKMKTQIEILKKIAGSLSKELQDMQSQILSQLEGKLKTASLMLDQIQSEKRKFQGNMRASEKAKYVLRKTTLNHIVEDIEKWQARFDPSWILIMQMSIRDIDEGLQEQQRIQDKQIPIIIAAKGIRDAARIQDKRSEERDSIWIDHLDLQPKSIPCSSVQLSTLDSNEMILIDTMITNPTADTQTTLRGVQKLARILAEVDPSTFSLLKCRGVIKVVSATKSSTWKLSCANFKFIFNVPPQLSNPQSLRTVLNSSVTYPLDERLNLAKRLVSSILFVHTIQFVHKNIRPETIIVFQNESSEIGAPFLAGFEQFRIEDGNTYRAGDSIWGHNLYRHPSRQGTHPEVNYQMQHDIYSLGVVLLEIGLGSSFLLYKHEETSSSAVPSNILRGAGILCPQVSVTEAFQLKLSLEKLAGEALPARLGRRYTDIVLQCLRCLDVGHGSDQNGKGFGADATSLANEDGVTIGVRYIENVLEKIQEITI